MTERFKVGDRVVVVDDNKLRRTQYYVGGMSAYAGLKATVEKVSNNMSMNAYRIRPDGSDRETGWWFHADALTPDDPEPKFPFDIHAIDDMF